jgi:hypothetical protein
VTLEYQIHPTSGVTMSLWWISIIWTPKWSREETSVRARIWALSIVFSFCFYLPQLAIYLWFGLERHWSAVIAGWTSIPPALYCARCLCKSLWRDLVQKADANAAKRLGEQ